MITLILYIFFVTKHTYNIILRRYRMVYHKNMQAFRIDGLNSINYELIAIVNKPLYKLVSITYYRMFPCN